MDRGAWQATVRGVTNSQTRLRDALALFFHSSNNDFPHQDKARDHPLFPDFPGLIMVCNFSLILLL